MSKSKAFEVAVQLVQADIIAERVMSEIKPVVVEKPVIVEKLVQHVLQTEFEDLTDQTVNGTLKVLDEEGSGKVEKLLLRSLNQNFGIILRADNGTELNGSWSDFQDVFGFQDQDGTYVLEMTNINYARNITVTVTTTSPVTFSRIFIKYTRRKSGKP